MSISFDPQRSHQSELLLEETGEEDADAMLALARAIIDASGQLSEGAVKALVFLPLYIGPKKAKPIVQQVMLSKIRQTGNQKYLQQALAAAARDKLWDQGVKPGGKS